MNLLSETYHERSTRYLLNRMPPAERLQFDLDLLIDPALQAVFAQERWLTQCIRNYGMGKKFEAFFTEAEPAYARRRTDERRLAKVVKITGIAIAAMLAFVAGFFFIEKQFASEATVQAPQHQQGAEQQVGALETMPMFNQIIAWEVIEISQGKARTAVGKDSVALVFFKNPSSVLACSFHDKLLEIYLPAQLAARASAADGAPLAADFDGDGVWEAALSLRNGEADFFKNEAAAPALFRLLEVERDGRRQLFFQVNHSFFLLEETKDKTTLAAFRDEALKIILLSH